MVDPNLLEDLPQVVKELVFSFLSVWDLKTVRLVSTRLARDVFSLDKRFRMYTVRSSRDLPKVQHSKNITVCLKIQKVENRDTLIDWLQDHSSIITELRLTLKAFDSRFVNSLASSDFEFPQLKTVKLDLHCISIYDTEKILLKFGHLTEVLSIDISVPLYRLELDPVVQLNMSALRVVRLSVDFLEQILKICQPTTKSVRQLEILQGSESNFRELDLSTCFNTLQHLKIEDCYFNDNQLYDLMYKNATSLKSVEIDNVNIKQKLDFAMPSLCKLTVVRQRDFHHLSDVMKTVTEMQLERVNIPINHDGHNLPALKKLIVSECGPEGVISLLGMCTNLEDLELSNMMDMTIVRDFDIPNMKRLALRQLVWGGLEKLVNSFQSSLESLLLICLSDAQFDWPLLSILPALKRLNLESFTRPFNFPLSSCPSLETLVLGAKLSYRTEDVPALPKVKHLLVNKPQQDQQSLGNFVNSCGSHLETLVLGDICIFNHIESRLNNLKRLYTFKSLSEEKQKLLQENHLPKSVEHMKWTFEAIKNNVNFNHIYPY